MITPEVGNFLLSDDGLNLREDILSWLEWRGEEPPGTDREITQGFVVLMKSSPPFRALADYRLAKGKVVVGRRLVPKLLRPDSLFIAALSIGPRCRIQHGHSTWIMGTIGSDFTIRHNCTVGKHRGLPTIGDRVEMGTGSVIYGKVIIGDDVKIAPCVAINSDIPSNSVVRPAVNVIIQRKASSEA
jgi:serine O-acetyltransferase